MPIRAVIFDLDGLIVDSEPLHQAAFHRLFQNHGIDYHFDEDEYGRHFVGIPVSQNTAWLPPRFDWNKPVAELIQEREQIFEGLIANPINLKAFPGLRKVLDVLQEKKLRTAVASGSPRHHVTMVLQGLQIESYFSVILGGNDVPKKKPAPDVYIRAIELLGFPSEDCIALEDSITGVVAAKSAGLKVFAVPNRYTQHQDLSAADICLSSLIDLLPYLPDS